MRIIALLLLSLLLPSTFAAGEPTLEQLLENTDDATRGASSDAVVEMHVKTAQYERTMKMRMWSSGSEKTLVRILEPAKDAGITTLKVDQNIWNYLPKVDRTLKVPAGMMSGNWMGSHFTNDDLVKESRLSDDFDGRITSRPSENAEGVYVIELKPKPEAAVVWGSIVAKIRPDRLPVSVAYNDEQGKAMRTILFSDVKNFDGHMVPSVMRLIPADKPGEFTEMTYLSIDFDVVIPESTFTLQALKP